MYISFISKCPKIYTSHRHILIFFCANKLRSTVCELWPPLNCSTMKILHVPMDATPVKYTCGLYLYSHGILLFFFFRTLILFWETIYEFGSHLLSVFINAYNVSFKSSPRGETVIKPIIEMMAAPSYKINRHIFLKDINISVMIFTPVYCNPRNMHDGVRYYLLEPAIHIPPLQSKNHVSAGYAVEILILDRT